MKCISCNELLSEYEATRKTANYQFLDMCNVCYSSITEEVITYDRQDLIHESDVINAEDNYLVNLSVEVDSLSDVNNIYNE